MPSIEDDHLKRYRLNEKELENEIKRDYGH